MQLHTHAHISLILINYTKSSHKLHRFFTVKQLKLSQNQLNFKTVCKLIKKLVLIMENN